MALRERAAYAARLQEIDNEVKRIVGELQARGMKSPYLRSYVVALGFVFFRLMVVSPLLAGLGSMPERYTALLWLSWTVPLFVAEVILQWRRSVPAAAGMRAVAAEATS